MTVTWSAPFPFPGPVAYEVTVDSLENADNQVSVLMVCFLGQKLFVQSFLFMR